MGGGNTLSKVSIVYALGDDILGYWNSIDWYNYSDRNSPRHYRPHCSSNAHLFITLSRSGTELASKHSMKKVGFGTEGTLNK